MTTLEKRNIKAAMHGVVLEKNGETKQFNNVGSRAKPMFRAHGSCSGLRYTAGRLASQYGDWRVKQVW